MVNINSFYIEKVQMMPAYSYPFQPYILLPNIPSPMNTMVYQNNGLFYLQSFVPPMNFQSSNSNYNQSTQHLSPLPTQINSGNNKKTPIMAQNKNDKPQSNIIKEKIIKKPANRPATYLTERKFYLAQAPPSEENSQRRLRHRQTKKRCPRGTATSSMQEQCLAAQKGVNQEEIVRIQVKEEPKNQHEKEIYSKLQLDQSNLIVKAQEVQEKAIQQLNGILYQ